MNQILNRNYSSLPKTDIFLSSTILMKCSIPLNPSILQGGCIPVPLPERNLPSGFEFLLGFRALYANFPQNYFETLKFKVWTKFQFLRDTLWWPMNIKPCLIFFSFLLLFIYVFNLFITPFKTISIVSV